MIEDVNEQKTTTTEKSLDKYEELDYSDFSSEKMED